MQCTKNSVVLLPLNPAPTSSHPPHAASAQRNRERLLTWFCRTELSDIFPKWRLRNESPPLHIYIYYYCYLHVHCFTLSALNCICCFIAQLFNIIIPFNASLLSFISTALDSILPLANITASLSAAFLAYVTGSG